MRLWDLLFLVLILGLYVLVLGDWLFPKNPLHVKQEAVNVIRPAIK